MTVKMKSLSFAVLFLAAAVMTAQVVVLDSDRIVKESKPGKALQDKVQVLGKAKLEELQKLADALKPKDAPSNWNPEANTTYKRAKEDATTAVQASFTTGLSDLNDKALEIVKKIMAEKKATILLPKNAAIYVEAGADITDQVLKELDK